MDIEIKEMFQMIINKIDGQDKRFESIDKRFESMEKEIRDFRTEINIKIENDVTKRIDVLFDGYKLVHEKQWELERKVERLERRLECLEAAV